MYNTRATHVAEVINKHYLHTYAHATIKHAKAMRSILYKGLRTFMIYEYEGVLSVLFFMLKCKCQVVMQELGKCMYIYSCIYLYVNMYMFMHFMIIKLTNDRFIQVHCYSSVA